MGRGGVISVAAAAFVLFTGGQEAAATVPPPPSRCPTPFANALAPAPIDPGNTALRLTWGSSKEDAGSVTLRLKRPDGSEVLVDNERDAFGLLVRPRERIGGTAFLLEYTDSCDPSNLHTFALDFVANRTSPNQLGELAIQQEMYCPGEKKVRIGTKEVEADWPPPVSVRLRLASDLEPWRRLLAIELSDDSGFIKAQPAPPAETEMQWDFRPACGMSSSLSLGSHDFTAVGNLPDGVVLGPALISIEVRCPVCAPRVSSSGSSGAPAAPPPTGPPIVGGGDDDSGYCGVSHSGGAKSGATATATVAIVLGLAFLVRRRKRFRA